MENPMTNYQPAVPPLILETKIPEILFSYCITGVHVLRNCHITESCTVLYQSSLVFSIILLLP